MTAAIKAPNESMASNIIPTGYLFRFRLKDSFWAFAVVAKARMTAVLINLFMVERILFILNNVIILLVSLKIFLKATWGK
jgi:hypothetical protein